MNLMCTKEKITKNGYNVEFGSLLPTALHHRSAMPGSMVITLLVSVFQANMEIL